MGDVWDRLINAFFGFKNAKGHYAYSYGRYRDVVVSDDGRSSWYLHGNRIAELKRTENGLYILRLSNAGYNTQTTISRLNLIVNEAYGRFMNNARDAPLFRLKHHRLGFKPIATYVEYQGQTFLLTGKEVKIVFFPERKKADVDVYGREILFFKDSHGTEIDRKLRKVRRLRWEISTLLEKIKDANNEIGEQVEERYSDTLALIDAAGLEYYGLFVEYMKEPDYTLLVDTLRNIRDTLKLIYNEDPEKMRASVMMVL